MLKGFHLTLLIGPAVPIPAPQLVIDALTAVQVTSSKDRSGFQLTFGVSTRSPLLTTMLPAGYLDPMITRVIIIVTLGGLPHVLMDGIITRQELSPSNEPGQSTLTVTGEDLSVLMDVVEVPFLRYPMIPDFGRINLILAKYLFLGIVPLVIPPVIFEVPLITEEIPTHKGTDLEYVRTLASQCGYVFYVEPGPVPGTSIAYWGPDVRLPIPQPALNVNMDAHTNVETLSFSLDGLAKKILVLYVFDPETKKYPITVPVPNVSVLRPPLGVRPTPPARVEFPEGLAHLNPAEAVKRALGISFRSSDAISGSGSLNVLRYGRVLRSRQLVGVRGAGLAYDGLYYVNSVTHNIKRGEYKQSFNLSRDGLISLTPGGAMTEANGMRKYYGKYRGTVVNNLDPKMMGRLLVTVPDVLGLAPSSWAEPCVPLAGPTGPPMGVCLVPPVGAGVWVEFEQGDLDHPIWAGCRWGAPTDVPPLAKLGLPISPSIVLQTAGQNTIAISDLPGPTGGIMLKSTTGAMILVNDIGITISNGKGAMITMLGPTVAINQTALVVT